MKTLRLTTNEIYSHLSEKASKGRFLKPEKLQNHSNEGKGKEKKKEGGDQERRRTKNKAMVALLVFIMSYFGYSFWPKETVGRKRSI